MGGLQCDHIQTHKVNTYLITYIFGSINDKLSLQHHDLVLQWYFIKVHSHLVLGILVLEFPNTMKMQSTISTNPGGLFDSEVILLKS